MSLPVLPNRWSDFLAKLALNDFLPQFVFSSLENSGINNVVGAILLRILELQGVGDDMEMEAGLVRPRSAVRLAYNEGSLTSRESPKRDFVTFCYYSNTCGLFLCPQWLVTPA